MNREARTCFPVLLNLLKETKPQVSKKLPDCLDMMAKYCFEIDQVIPDFQASLASPVVLVKEETLNFLMRWMLIPESRLSFIKHSNSLADIILPRILEDKDNSVRNVATSCFGKLLQVCGGVNSLPTQFKKIEDVDKKRSAKIREVAESSTEDEKKEAPVGNVSENKATVKPVSKPVAAPVNSTAPKKATSSLPATSASVAPVKKTVASSSPLDNLEIPAACSMSPEEAFEKVNVYFSGLFLFEEIFYGR